MGHFIWITNKQIRRGKKVVFSISDRAEVFDGQKFFIDPKLENSGLIIANCCLVPYACVTEFPEFRSDYQVNVNIHDKKTWHEKYSPKKFFWYQ